MIPGWSACATRPVPGEAYRVNAENDGELLYDDVGLTNGIGFSPDGRRVYHSDSLRSHVIVHDVVDGTCRNRQVLARMPSGAPDWLAVDEHGCLWVAAYGDDPPPGERQAMRRGRRRV